MASRAAGLSAALWGPSAGKNLPGLLRQGLVNFHCPCLLKGLPFVHHASMPFAVASRDTHVLAAACTSIMASKA